MVRRPEKKDKQPEGKVVDTGSFGVFMNGHGSPPRSFPSSRIRPAAWQPRNSRRKKASTQAAQSSELQLAATGELRKYEWKEISPGKAQAVIVPNDNLLVERSTANPQDKPEEHPFLLPTSTSVLDDYFFIHREILVWKYLATGCRQDKGVWLARKTSR